MDRSEVTETTEQSQDGRLQSAQFGLYSKAVSSGIEGHCGNLPTKRKTTQGTHRFLDEGVRVFVRDNKHNGIVECLSPRKVWKFDGHPYLCPLVSFFVLPLFFPSSGMARNSKRICSNDTGHGGGIDTCTNFSFILAIRCIFGIVSGHE